MNISRMNMNIHLIQEWKENYKIIIIVAEIITNVEWKNEYTTNTTTKNTTKRRKKKNIWKLIIG